MNAAASGQAGAAYAGIRRRVHELVGGVSDRLGDTVPACPQWRVRDLVAHLAGVVDDVLGGRLEGAGSDHWTDAQVVARRDRDVDELLAEWNAQATQLEAVLDSFGPPGRQLVMDAVTHEHDLRGALGAPGERDSEAVVIGLDWLASAYQGAAGAGGHPGLRIVATDGAGATWVPPIERPVVATVSGSSFDLLRSLSGRRSEAEIRDLSWDGDIDAVLPSFTFGPFRLPAQPLGE